MALFLSTYINKIDKKGRVSVPASFRSVLSNQNFSGIVVYPSVVNKCIEACSMEKLEDLYENIDSLDPLSDEKDAFEASILGGCVTLSFDGEGRVLLPEQFVEEAGISEQAVFIGKGKKFEIWSVERFEKYSANARELAKKNRAALSKRRGDD